MKNIAQIKAPSLKDFLSLFDEKNELKNLSLGDSWHPSSGFVDEGILEGKNRIVELLNFDYDFKGLVHFQAEINEVHLRLIGDEDKETFEIEGNMKEIKASSILTNMNSEKAREVSVYLSGEMKNR